MNFYSSARYLHRNSRLSYVRDWFLHSEKLGAQLTVIAASIIWAVFLLHPESSLSNSRYAFMAHFGNDAMWAAVFLISAGLQFYSIVIRSRALVRCAAGLLACTTHLIAGVNFWVFRWPEPAVATAPEFAIVVAAAVVYLFTPQDPSESRHDRDS